MERKLYKQLLEKLRDHQVDFQKDPETSIQILLEVVKNYLSLELFRKEKEVMVIDLPSHLILSLYDKQEEKEQEPYFQRLMEETIDAYNRKSKKQIVLLPGEENEMKEEMGNYFFQMNTKESSAQNYIFLLETLENMHQKNFVKEKRK